MNIGTRFDLTAANDTALPRRSRLASDSSAFAENLAVERESFTHRCIQGPGFSLRMGENILCSGGVGGADVQTYEAEFTAGSTDEDPVVRIRGKYGPDIYAHARELLEVYQEFSRGTAFAFDEPEKALAVSL